MGLLVAFAALSIMVSFLCSILEAVLLSLTPSYIAALEEVRPGLYRRLSVLKNRIDQPLAAILTLNTIAHTFGAAGVGAQVGIVFGDGYLGVASAVMTFLILVLSEIIPKSLGARYWQVLAPMLPLVLGFLILVFKPFIALSDMITGRLVRGVPINDLRAEIKAMTRIGVESRHLDGNEQRVICNILDLHELRLRDKMTPRTVCKYMLLDSTVGDCDEVLQNSGFSRYPVLDADEHPHGIVFRNELLEAEPEQPLRELLRPAEIFNDDTSVEDAMNKLMARHQHMALVYDEYGTWMGLITMEDMLETILGQSIMDEKDDIPDLRRHARRRWENRLRNR